jgi:hypothetical protein
MPHELLDGSDVYAALKHMGGERRPELVGVAADARPPLQLAHPILHSMLAGHDEGVPLARRKLAKLNDGRPAHRSERDGAVYLEPARATLRVSEDNMRVGYVF